MDERHPSAISAGPRDWVGASELHPGEVGLPGEVGAKHMLDWVCAVRQLLEFEIMIVPGEAQSLALDGVAAPRQPLPKRQPSGAIGWTPLGREIGGDDKLNAKSARRMNATGRIGFELIEAYVGAYCGQPMSV
jgi:hypothetical protein